MAKIEHPQYGTVSERSFPAAALDATTRSFLVKFKGEGILTDFLETDTVLTIWRPWVEGEPLEEFFLDLRASERLTYSQTLFYSLSARLALPEYRHGALHPGNMILAAKGVDLVDATFNSVTFSGTTLANHRWFWREKRTEEFTEAEWDWVTLLRTASILGSDLFLDSEGPTTPTAIALCESWMAKYSKILTPGSDVANRLNHAFSILRDKICNLSEKGNTKQGKAAELSKEEHKTENNEVDPTEEIEEYLLRTWRAIKKGDSQSAQHYINMFFLPQQPSKENH